jgi:Ser-tRNA(Ala) deacylase AlaX
MTDLLYMQDFDVEACEAVIKSILATQDDRKAIELDRTCFYARGGGQDWDTGIIEKDGTTFLVEEVRLDENGIVHHIGTFQGEELQAGDTVNCKVNHERRVINTRLHSAGHIIDMAIDSLGLDWVATKGQHYPHLSAVEYSGTWQPEQAEELKQKIEQATNAFIVKGTDNSLEFMPVDEMHKVVRHVPANIPKNKPGRVVMYGENFGIPCGGTHVRNLSQIGTVLIPKLKEKKGIIRVNYTVEGIN